MVSRRHALAVVGACLAAPWVPRTASAGVARGLPLEQLVARSGHVLRGLPLEAYSEWTRIGGERRIVTYTRLRVDDPVIGGDDHELLVRTLGGTVGEIGQIVHGEATLLVGEPCVAFLKPWSDGMLGVTAMAQGHYPLLPDKAGILRLTPSPDVSFLLEEKASAVARLKGRSLEEAKSLVRAAKP